MILYDNSPAKVSDEAAAMAPAWEIVTALMGGTAAMRAASKKYLPKHPAEGEESYQHRLSVSTLYGAYRRTVETMSARPFAEPVKMGDDIPPALVEYTQNIDLEGRDLQAFAHSVFASALTFGLAHILVDYPKSEGITTKAEQVSAGVRPYWSHIDPRNVLGWRAERINGVQTLTMLRLAECVTEPDGQWLNRTVEQIRVLEPYRFSVYRKNDKAKWVLHEEGPVSIGVIPLATVYTSRTGFMTAEPPLLGMAYLNVEHWQSSSDQQNILHVARVPILFGSGFAEGSLKIGANSGVTNEAPDAKLMYVEHSGAAIEAGRQSLLDLEARMSAMGAELLVSKPGTRTATEASIDTAESTSALAAMVNNLEDSLALALQFSARWEGLPQGGTVELEGDFTVLDTIDVANLVNAHDSHIISAETVFATLQRNGKVDEAIEWKDEQARIAAEQQEAQKAAAAQIPEGVSPGPVSSTGLQSDAAAPNFGPLIESIGSLVAQLGKPETEQEPAFDLAPIIAAIRESKPAPMDMASLADALKGAQPETDTATADAIKQLAEAIKAQPASQITMPAVTMPALTLEPLDLQPLNNALSPAIEAMRQAVEAMKNMPAPVVNPPAPEPEKKRVATFTTDADGMIVGAVIE